MKTLNIKNKRNFYKSFFQLIKAGFTIYECVDKFKSEYDVKMIQRIYKLTQNNFVLDSGEEGNEMSKFELNIILNSIKTGTLETSLDYLYSYYSTLHKVLNKFISKMLYPLFLVFFASVALSVQEIFSSKNSMFEFIYIFGKNIVFFGIVPSILILIITFMYKNACKSIEMEKIVRKIPIYNKVWENYNMMIFINTLRNFWSAGLSVSEALKISGSNTKSPMVNMATKSMEINLVKKGYTLSELFAIEKKSFSEEFVNSIHTSEESGSIDENLSKWSVYYIEGFKESLNILSLLIAKKIYFIVVILIGYRIIKFYSDYWSMLNNIIDIN